MCHPCVLPTSYSPWHQFHSHLLGITPCIGYVKHAHSQHIKVFKHFVYIQYGCGMPSTLGVCSLNHDTTTSYRLGHTPFPLIFTPSEHVIRHKCVPILCPSTASSQGAQTLCLHPIWMWDVVNGGLQPQPLLYTATSYRFGNTPLFLKYTLSSTCNSA